MSVYDEGGNIVEETNARVSGGKIHDISSILDHGREPDFAKESLIAKPVTVYGIVGPELFPLGPVYFVLLKRKEDAEIDDPWGVMFPARSPVVSATLRAVRQKMLPFTGILERVTSAENSNRQYWQWARR